MSAPGDIIERLKEWERHPYGSIIPLLRDAAAEILTLRGALGFSEVREPAPDLSTLPRRVDRRSAAALVTRYFFPVSPRSLEIWPVRVTRVNGRALIETRELFDEAERRLADASAGTEARS